MPPSTTTKYQKQEIIPSNEWLTIHEPVGDTSKQLSFPVDQSTLTETLSDNMKLASAVAQTAMILNHSEFTGTATYDSILKQLYTIANINSNPYRAEFVSLITNLPKCDAKPDYEY